MPGRSQHGRANRAFSLIEMLIVLGVMLLLSTLSITGITKSLRVSAVQNALSAIQTASTTSMTQALRLQSVVGQAYPGVLIAMHDERWSIAPILATAAQASAVDFDKALVDDDGRSSIIALSPNVTLWIGDAPAQNTDRIAWFYEPSTARLVIASGGGFSQPGAMVGYTPPALTASDGSKLVFGAPASGGYDVIAAPTSTNPGLSLRSKDQKTKWSVSVQPSGTLMISEF